MRGDPPLLVLDGRRDKESTPHARGSTPLIMCAPCYICVYPACAGIHLTMRSAPRSKPCLPRMRGDPPIGNSRLKYATESTPHARGSTHVLAGLYLWVEVYPACAGIHRTAGDSAKTTPSLPRMRGDPPRMIGCSGYLCSSTPHARGSTTLVVRIGDFAAVYPACAGIHPGRRLTSSTLASLPRMRGDPPLKRARLGKNSTSTPHARGSTQSPHRLCRLFHVYPACAGIHPTNTCRS